MTPYDVDRVRACFPALAEGTAHFDGPGGSQVPEPVARAVADTLTSSIANRGRVSAAERRADDVVTAARRAVADLVGGTEDGVVFGRSMTQLTYDLARTLAASWGPGDEVVVTRLDHDANIRPWVQAAQAAGATVRWAPFDPQTGELAASAVTGLFSERTRVVAVTAASNLIGTRPDVAAIAQAAHAVGALVHVDGVHLTPHAPVDVSAMGADFYTTSPYKWMGPHHGALIADPALLDTLHPPKLLPASDQVPERFELGTLPYELLAGTAAAVDFIADLVPSVGDRRSRVVASMAATQAYEHGLFVRLHDALEAMEGISLHGRAALRTPTVLFSVRGRPPAQVHEMLAARGVNTPGDNFYALEASRWMGLGDAGAVRAGIAPYTDDTEVDRLLEGAAALL